jgi:hypothetical protein
VTKSIEQVPLSKPFPPRTRCIWGRNTLHTSFCAIGAWEFTITFDLSGLTKHACEHARSSGRSLGVARRRYVSWTFVGSQYFRRHAFRETSRVRCQPDNRWGADVDNERARERLMSDATAIGHFYCPRTAPPLGRLENCIEIVSDLQTYVINPHEHRSISSG